MKYLIIDSSSMLFGFSNNNNVFDIASGEFHGITMLVSAGIVGELRSISRNKGEKGRCASIALMELRAKKIEIDNIKGADEWIFGKARSNTGSIVITNDTELAKRLLDCGIKVLKLSRSGILKAAR